MEKDTKLSKEQIENIKNELKGGSVNRDNLNEFLGKHLDSEGSEKIKAVLSNPEKLKEILSSPFAKSFMEKYKNKE